MTQKIDFDLRHLEIFCKVVETRSITKASQAVNLVQASVSERIIRLEELIGLPLFDRIGRQMIPTQAGMFLYARARDMMDLKRKICMEMEDYIGLGQGEVCMGGSTVPGEYILPRLIGKFCSRYPGIRVDVRIADSQRIIDDIRQGNLEIGVAGSVVPDTLLTFVPLWDDELVLITPPNHAWADRQSVKPEDMSDQPLVLREHGSGTLKLLEDSLSEYGIMLSDFHVIARLGSSVAVKEAVNQGVGISVLSKRTVEQEIQSNRLCCLRIEGLSLTRYFYLITHNSRHLSPHAKAFADFLTNEKTA